MTPGAGQMVGAWSLHAGDRITVHNGTGGDALAAVVTAIRDTPDPVRGGGDHELDWTSVADSHVSGHLHYAMSDLVDRLYENTVTL